jgi:beta-lactamase regulating signal transducer with metallopeptidase domain
MTDALVRLADNRVLVVAGWTLLLIAWESGLIAVLLEVWRTLRSRASARAQYSAALLAFSVALLIAAATPALLLSYPASAGPQREAVTSRASGTVAPSAPVAAMPASQPAAAQLAGIRADVLAGWAGLAWLTGVVVLAVKLSGGWLLARRVRRRAIPAISPSARECASRLRSELGVSLPIALLQSHEVEAPVVVGWRRPALILPDDVAEQLAPEMVEPLILHELAHIKRHDYVVNLVQTCADLLLFFSPGVTWMSRRIREAREYCCDDVAVVKCGDPKHYVRALTTLAALGTIHNAKPSLGAAGPRLIVRVRRLLEEKAMHKLAAGHLAALATVFVVLVVTGAKVAIVSAAHAGAAVRSMHGAVQDSIPFGYATEQPGSSAVLTRVVSSADHPAELATVRNTATEPISGIVFAVMVEFLPRNQPVRIFTSELRPVSIAPGETAQVAPQAISSEQLREIASHHTGRLQIFVGLATIRYANGFEWSVTPNPAAMSGSDALSIPRLGIPRSLVVPAGSQAQPAGSLCYNEQRKTFSLGAVIAIAGEPGHFARCVSGQWIETTVR